MGSDQEVTRPTLYEEAGNFALLLHHSQPKAYPEEAHDTVQICIPYHLGPFTPAVVLNGALGHALFVGLPSAFFASKAAAAV